MRISKKLTYIPGYATAFSLSIIALVLIQVAIPQKVSAKYNGARIIDNSVFLDANSMSAGQIQNFLNGKNSGIADRTFGMDCNAAGTTAKQAYLRMGAPCNSKNGTSAARIIYYASRVYGLNPKVILATMQKEQGLITSPNPTQRQMKQAMGYACPTSGNCLDSSTFFYQIDNGSWVLRFHYERARGNNSWWYESSGWVCGTEKAYYKPNLYPNQNVRFYDQDGVHYRTHHLYSAATSAMYCYTPHAYNNPDGLYGHPEYGTKGRYYSGSYNFVLWYEKWFGATNKADKIRFITCGGQKYSVEEGANGKRRMTATAVQAWGLLENDFVENGFGCSLPTFDEPLSRLLRSRNTGNVYLVDEGKVYEITNQPVANGWGLGSINQTLPMFFGPSLHEELSVKGTMPRVVESTSTNVTKKYIIDSGQRHVLAGTEANNDDSSLRLVKGYDTVGYGVLSVELLSLLPEAAQEIDFSFRIGTTQYLLNHGELLKIDSSNYARWNSILDDPQLSSSAASIFARKVSMGKGFQRSGYYYQLTAASQLERTTSFSVAQNWGASKTPGITQLLTDKITGLDSPTQIFGLDKSIRIFRCGSDEYLAEHGVDRKRKLTSDGMNAWNFETLYFNTNDKRCGWPALDTDLDKVIRSRSTGKEYLVQDGKAYYIHSQAAANEWSLGNVESQTYPLFYGSTMHDHLEIVDSLPSP